VNSLQHLELRDLTQVAYLDLLQETGAAVGAQLPDEHVAIAYFPNLANRAAGMVMRPKGLRTRELEQLNIFFDLLSQLLLFYRLLILSYLLLGFEKRLLIDALGLFFFFLMRCQF
jgi:hypothetical protein